MSGLGLMGLTFTAAGALSILGAWAPPEVGGCPVFPPDHVWNARVDQLPVHPHSAEMVVSIGPTAPLHPDFGAGKYRGASRGIPFVVVDPGVKKTPVAFRSAEESDKEPYPIPVNPPIEGAGRTDGRGDRHLLMIHPKECRLYELFAVYPANGGWEAGSGAIFDLRGYGLRPKFWTSADAAGLPIFPGLVRYEEVARGEIGHALRVTVPRTRGAFVWPGRHRASRLNSESLPAMGQRFRLRAGFDTSGLAPQARVIAEALKRYGMMVADHGGAWFLSGAPDERWIDGQLAGLKRIKGMDFEAVDMTSLMADEETGRVRSGKE